MKKYIKFMASIAAITSIFAFTFTASAANKNQTNQTSNILCFSGTQDTADNPGYGPYNGTCQLTSTGAILNTIDNDTDPNNAYAGVYSDNSDLGGKLLSDITNLSFSYAAADGTTASGGSPRLSIPIDQDNNGTTDGYAFIDTIGCNDGNSSTGTLDAINDTTCSVTYNGTTYNNFSDFASANPTYKVATDAVTFVIIDQPGQFTISNVQLGNYTSTASGKSQCKKGGFMTFGNPSYKNQGQCVKAMK